MSNNEKNKVNEIVSELRGMDAQQQDAVLSFAAGMAAAVRIGDTKKKTKRSKKWNRKSEKIC